MITIIILSLLTLGILVSWTLARRRQRLARSRMDDIPLFALPASAQRPIARPSTPPVGPDRAHAVSPTLLRDTPAGADAPLDLDRFAPPAPVIRTRDGGVSTLARSPRNSHAADDPDDTIGEAVDGASLRYWRPADGTLQFLPGRLEVAAGHEAGQEIRFVRTAGPDGTTVTFGRAEGAPYRHVQLREPTVSRAHARLSLERAGDPSSPAARSPGSVTGARWLLENLSATNPVVVNGQPLQSTGQHGSSVILSDGDRIEMGEVAFIYHAR